MHFHEHQPCPPPIRSIASDQIGYGQRYLIENAAIFGVNSLGDGTYLHAEAFSVGAPFLHIEVAHASIGVHNEYFLHHRSRSRSPLRCRFLGAARLNKQFDTRLVTDQRRNGPLTSGTLPLGTNVRPKRLISPNKQPWEVYMADNSGGVGVMGVLVGALIVIVVGAGLLFATGTLGSKTSTVKLELPKITTGAK
jgi:hypothetical protein